MRKFDWRFDMGAAADIQHRVNKTQFGDGYAQRAPDGINNKALNWSGIKTGDFETTINPIIQFLDDHRGVTPFLWTDPHGNTKKYTCEDYTATQRRGSYWQITLKFEQVPA